MKNDKYIDKVLSHIHSKQRKSEIEPELFDHIDENEKFFAEIGYDEIAAAENADGKMGDADIVGEQLAVIGRKQNKSRTAFAVITLILGIAFVIYNIASYNSMMSRSLSSDLADITYPALPVFSSFFLYCIYSVLLILALSNLLIGFKSKKIFTLLSGFLSAEALIVFGPHCLTDSLENIIYGKSTAERFYIDGFFIFNTPLNFLSGSSIALIAVFSALIMAIFLAGLVIAVKTKGLKNTAKDIKTAKIFSVITAIFMVFVCVLFAATICKTVLIKDEMKASAVERIKAADTEFLNNYSRFFTTDKNNLSKALEDTFDKGTYYREYSYDEQTDNTVVTAYNDHTEDFPAETVINIEYYIYNPFTPYEGIDLFDNIGDIELSPSTKITDIPLPAYLSLDYTDERCVLTFFYSTDDYGNERNIIFAYNNDTDEFELLDSYFLEFDEKDIALTEEQEKQLDSALLTEGGIYKNLYKEIYEISCNEDMDIYKIDLSYCEYTALTHAGDGEYYISNYQPMDGGSIRVKFENGTAVILNELIYGDSGSFNELKTIYSKEAYEKYSDRDTDWESKLLRYHKEIMKKEQR